MSSRISEATAGRPFPFRRLFQVQYSLKPFRCHRTTVSGFTKVKVSVQSFQTLDRSTPKDPIALLQAGTFDGALKDGNLLSEGEILKGQLPVGSQDGEQCSEQR